jgi:hypothetical protein
VPSRRWIAHCGFRHTRSNPRNTEKQDGTSSRSSTLPSMLSGQAAASSVMLPSTAARVRCAKEPAAAAAGPQPPAATMAPRAPAGAGMARPAGKLARRALVIPAAAAVDQSTKPAPAHEEGMVSCPSNTQLGPEGGLPNRPLLPPPPPPLPRLPLHSLPAANVSSNRCFPC